MWSGRRRCNTKEEFATGVTVARILAIDACEISFVEFRIQYFKFVTSLDITSIRKRSVTVMCSKGKVEPTKIHSSMQKTHMQTPISLLAQMQAKNPPIEPKSPPQNITCFPLSLPKHSSAHASYVYHISYTDSSAHIHSTSSHSQTNSSPTGHQPR